MLTSLSSLEFQPGAYQIVHVPVLRRVKPASSPPPEHTYVTCLPAISPVAAAAVVTQRLPPMVTIPHGHDRSETAGL